MPGKQTKTGQQYSESTPYKLQGFRYLMNFHAGVCQHILQKCGQKDIYVYIDLNCGAGHQPEYKEFGNEEYGSPIIAIKSLNDKGIEPMCHFCDISQEALDKLKSTIAQLQLKCDANYWQGNNKESLIDIVSQIPNNSSFLGLVYSDPNGKQDFPLKEIKEVFQCSQMQRVDLLLNVASNYVKRWAANPKATWETYSLDELIHGHGKKKVFVREPENSSLKWTFIYATNWSKQKELKKIRLYDINKDTGKDILNHLFDPYSHPLPYFGHDGQVYSQGNLFDNFLDENTRD